MCRYTTDTIVDQFAIFTTVMNRSRPLESVGATVRGLSEVPPSVRPTATLRMKERTILILTGQARERERKLASPTPLAVDQSRQITTIWLKFARSEESRTSKGNNGRRAA